MIITSVKRVNIISDLIFVSKHLLLERALIVIAQSLSFGFAQDITPELMSGLEKR